jgi:uncharacterized lipoprotein YmbA
MMGDRFDFDAGGGRVSIIPDFRYVAVLLCGVLFFSFIGCAGTEKSRFYTLDYLAMASSKLPDTRNTQVSIGIGPIRLPEYLNRPQIVTRTSKYKLDVAEFDRWAAPLDTVFARVLAENLSILLSTDRVYLYPWNTSRSLDYQVVVEIIQLDGNIPGDANLFVRWSLLKEAKATRIIQKKFQCRKPIAGQGYPGLVSAMSLGIVDLSREIATAIAAEQLGANHGEE